MVKAMASHKHSLSNNLFEFETKLKDLENNQKDPCGENQSIKDALNANQLPERLKVPRNAICDISQMIVGHHSIENSASSSNQSSVRPSWCFSQRNSHDDSELMQKEAFRKSLSSTQMRTSWSIVDSSERSSTTLQHDSMEVRRWSVSISNEEPEND